MSSDHTLCPAENSELLCSCKPQMFFSVNGEAGILVPEDELGPVETKKTVGIFDLEPPDVIITSLE